MRQPAAAKSATAAIRQRCGVSDASKPCSSAPHGLLSKLSPVSPFSCTVPAQDHIHRRHLPLATRRLAAITDEACRSLYARPEIVRGQQCARRGRAGEATEQLPVVAVVNPVRRSVIPLVVLAAELSWLLIAQTTSAQRASSGQAPSPFSTMPGRRPWRRSPVFGMRCPPIRSVVRGPAVRPVRCPARPVSGRLVRRPGSGVRPPGVHPSGVQPAGVRPRSVRTRPSGPHQAVALGTGQGGTAPLPRERGQVPVDCRVVQRLESTAEQARTQATAPRSRMVGGLSVADPGPGWVRAAAALDAGLPGRPGRGAVRPSPAAARGTGGGRRARWPHRPRGCRPRAGWRPRWVVVVRPAARVGGPGGADGLAGGDGRAAPARPRLAVSAPGSRPAAF
jgi:hypothetical protein